MSFDSEKNITYFKDNFLTFVANFLAKPIHFFVEKAVITSMFRHSIYFSEVYIFLLCHIIV